MARLTNRQMDVLAERVTDLLEEAHKASSDNVTLTEKYQNFEKTYSDPFTVIWKSKADAFYTVEKRLKELNEEKDELRTSATSISLELGYVTSNWQRLDPKELLERYLKQKKNEEFPNAEFNREKTLRRVQADILLSDVENPEQLVKSLVEKLK